MAACIGIGHQDFVSDALRCLRRAHTADKLCAVMSAITLDLGFEYFALIEHGDLRLGPPSIVCLQNYPAGWADSFIARQLYLHDPILRACLTTALGFAWSDIPKMIRLTDLQRRIIHEARVEGVRAGYSVPFNVPGERCGSSSFAARSRHAMRRASLPAAQLVGAFAFHTARRLTRPGELQHSCRIDLTSRQLDCIALAGQGKSDGVIAQLLGLSRKTVVNYMEAARARYGVATRQQLIVAALFDGHLGFPDLITRQ